MNEELLRQVDERMLRLAETIYKGKVERVIELTVPLKAECRRRGDLEKLADVEMIEEAAMRGLVTELIERQRRVGRSLP